MNNPEMEQQSPEDLADKIAEMDYATGVDAGLEGEAKARATRTRNQLEKQIADMTSEEEASEMIEAAKARLMENDQEDWDRLKEAA